MTLAEHHEAARLRSERWRRAHGIGPRRPAQRPWLSEGISRNTWYRRRKQAREREALAAVACRSQAMFELAEALAAALARDLERCAALERETMAILAELMVLAHSPASHVLGPG